MTDKVDEKLGELLDIQGEIVQAEKSLPAITHSRDSNRESDYKYSRENLYNLVERGQDAIEGILEIARESQHPIVYEVAGQLIKTTGEVTEKLIDLQKKMKDLEKDEVKPETVNNNLFVGSTAELQKLLKDAKSSE